jgi:hypothetical protein
LCGFVQDQFCEFLSSLVGPGRAGPLGDFSGVAASFFTTAEKPRKIAKPRENAGVNGAAAGELIAFLIFLWSSGPFWGAFQPKKRRRATACEAGGWGRRLEARREAGYDRTRSELSNSKFRLGLPS